MQNVTFLVTALLFSNMVHEKYVREEQDLSGNSTTGACSYICIHHCKMQSVLAFIHQHAALLHLLNWMAILGLSHPQIHLSDGYGHDPLTLMFLGGKQTFGYDEKSCKKSHSLAQEHLFMQPCSGLHHAVSSKEDRGYLSNSDHAVTSSLTIKINIGQVPRCNARLYNPLCCLCFIM